MLVDSTGSTHEAPLQGTGTGAEITVDPATVDFGESPVGTSDRRDIVIRNTGNVPAIVANIASTAPDFQSNGNQWCVGVRINPGSSCTMRIVFTPQAGGVRHGQLVISSNAPGSPAHVPLSGVGTVPGIAVDPTALDFGALMVGATSPPRSFTITSSGPAALRINEITLTGAHPGDFALTEDCSIGARPPGDDCVVTVTFAPTSPGTRTATVTIRSNAAGSPEIVNLTGGGT